MANGVLASYQSATTKYTNAYVDPASNPNGLVRADFPMYTVPSATLTSGSLRMMNNTGDNDDDCFYSFDRIFTRYS